MDSGNAENFPWFFILFILFILIRFYLQLRISEDPFIKRNFKRFLIQRNLQQEYKPFLTQYFTFYNSLDEKNKHLFERRVQRFIDLKEFIPRGGLKEVTPEMKTMIAATAIQITFGYPKIYFLHFWRILIYPGNYYSTITHKYHKGEVNVRGIIVLSWESFKEGFMDNKDGRNLGFHEMAHALRLTNIVQNEEYDFYDRQIMTDFENEANNEIFKILNSPREVSMFRDYSASNLHEFFAVAIENFFEKPGEFKNYNIKLYNLLTMILKIDPYEIYNNKECRKIA